MRVLARRLVTAEIDGRAGLALALARLQIQTRKSQITGNAQMQARYRAARREGYFRKWVPLHYAVSDIAVFW